GVTYNTTVNGHSKVDPNVPVTFHGGVGFDYRNFSVVAHTKDSLTLHYFSPDGESGFPGDVDFYVKHTVRKPAVWEAQMSAKFSKRTPFMPTTHLYVQLNAYNASEPGSLNHTIFINSTKYQATDDNFFSTAEIVPIAKGAPEDFSTPKQLGKGFDVDQCGVNCTGYDTYFVYEPYKPKQTVASAWSDASGIR
ncbi:galactose mutarotase-like protein, partial [Gloeophyllum trabeum ATCC 11539]